MPSMPQHSSAVPGSRTTVVICVSHRRALCLLLLCLSFAIHATAQDYSPGHFEVGVNFTAIHSHQLVSNFGPGVEGDFNIGRHFALDAALNWFPSNSRAGQTTIGLFGGKVGARTQHFGFFGKVRPGFVTVDNAVREETLVLSVGTFQAPIVRFDRLTERVLDLGGVVEYYPARRWALHWDIGDTLLFEEKGPLLNIVPPLILTPISPAPARTRNNFQFSSGVHYRF